MDYKHYTLPNQLSSFNSYRLLDYISPKFEVAVDWNKIKAEIDSASKTELYKKMKFIFTGIYFFSLIYFTTALLT